MDSKKAIVLLSGGLDSTTVLALAKSQGFECYSMSFDYGQRHRSELNQANIIAKKTGVIEHKVFNIDLGVFGGSALTDSQINVPVTSEAGIPITYVPARNTVFLSLALAWSEVLGSTDIFIGVNAVDYSGYPDCRPEYIEAFEKMSNLAIKSAVEGERVKIHTPLISLSKAEILKVGVELGVDYAETVSCYQADAEGRACGKCDSCRLRSQGFFDAKLKDVTRYQ